MPNDPHPDTLDLDEDIFTAATQWEAIGAWVAAVTCKLCGATILLDPRDDPRDEATGSAALHRRWHAQQIPPVDSARGSAGRPT